LGYPQFSSLKNLGDDELQGGEGQKSSIAIPKSVDRSIADQMEKLSLGAAH